MFGYQFFHAMLLCKRFASNLLNLRNLRNLWIFPSSGSGFILKLKGRRLAFHEARALRRGPSNWSLDATRIFRVER
jgi:hypothetical protein